jgi:hypothetical protein
VFSNANQVPLGIELNLGSEFGRSLLFFIKLPIVNDHLANQLTFNILYNKNIIKFDDDADVTHAGL